MKKHEKTLVLLDAHAIIHRAYHALPQFSNSSGEPTGALFGVGSMLLRVLQDTKPDYVIACYDLPEKTFRHHAYTDYKAGRTKAEEPLIRQIETSRELFKALSIPIFEAPGFEADDVIGTLVVQSRKQFPNMRVVIATGDMDTFQLVSGDDVVVFTLKKGIEDTVMIDEEAVRARFGFGPEHIPDYKGFRGDPSDNIPGVKGVGEKTASILLSMGDTLEGVYEILKKDSEKLKKAGVTERLQKILLEHEEDALFSKTLATIRLDSPVELKLPEHFPGVIDRATLMKFFDHFELRALKSRWTNFLDGKPPVSKEVTTATNDLPKEETVPAPTVLTLEEIEKLGIMLWVTNSEKTVPDEEDILNATKTDTAKEAEKVLMERMAQENLLSVWEEIEKPLIPIVHKMQEKGVRIDVEFLYKYEKKLAAERDILTGKIREYGGEGLNINSPKQLAHFLFDVLKLPHKGAKGKAGSFSTKSSVLDDLEGVHPVIADIMEYREIEKLLTTYVSVFPKLVASDGRLHTTFYQHGTTTGRFSSSDPNLQNIPIRTERGAKMRNAFIASPGYTLVSCDYSQVELRVAAFLADDTALLEVFRSGRDVHMETAARMFGKSSDQVTHTERRQAKTINFGVLYGMGVTALQKNLGVSRAEATHFLEVYRESYPQLAAYLESVKESVKKDGFTKTFFGRKRDIPLAKSPLPFLRAAGERMAINAPIQGTAADMMKLALRFVSEDISEKGLVDKVYPLLQVHDELVFEVEEGSLEDAKKLIVSAMESVFKRSFLHTDTPIDFIAEIKSGPSWGELG